MFIAGSLLFLIVSIQGAYIRHANSEREQDTIVEYQDFRPWEG